MNDTHREGNKMNDYEILKERKEKPRKSSPSKDVLEYRLFNHLIVYTSTKK